MNPHRHRRLPLALLLLLLPLAATGSPHRPESPDTVLIRLPGILGFPSIPVPSNPAPSPNAIPDPRPSDASLTVAAEATKAARELILAARRDADPRLLGRARLHLRPWWRSAEAPVEILLLRAEIRQGLHEFPTALEDVDLALRRDPRNAAAWLLKANLNQVLGDYDSARLACLQLARFADPLIAVTAAASVQSLRDGSPTSALLLENEIRNSTAANPSVRAWAFVTLGEIHARQGDAASAESAFRKALEIESGNPYVLAALADLLLGAGRAPEVVALLRDASAEALRLRRMEALQVTAPDDLDTRRLREEITDSFALARERNDELHLREQSRFTLRILNDANEAFRLARRNWALQKEPADLEVLVDAARAVGDATELENALGWARRFQPAVLAQLNRRQQP